MRDSYRDAASESARRVAGISPSVTTLRRTETMSSTVVCSVVQLAQHPPPVHVPLEHMALPVPIPGLHALARRAAKERRGRITGGLRSHRPAFQPFQLKPFMKGQDPEPILAVLGPNGHPAPESRASIPRSVTAPPTVVSSMDKKREEEKREPLSKTSHSSLSYRDLLTPTTKRSLSTFPARPALSKGKQVPGRFFPKPILTEEQKTQLEALKRATPALSKSVSLPSTTPISKPDASHGVGVFNSLPSGSVTRMDRQHSPSYNQRIARTRLQLQKERPDVRSEVFAICFKQDMDSKDYDPASELHSDYYSIKRLKMPMARLGRPMDISTNGFAVVLQGRRKHLHKKALLSVDDTDALLEPMVQTDLRDSGSGSLARVPLAPDEEDDDLQLEDADDEIADAEGQPDDGNAGEEQANGAGADGEQEAGAVGSKEEQDGLTGGDGAEEKQAEEQDAAGSKEVQDEPSTGDAKDDQGAQPRAAGIGEEKDEQPAATDTKQEEPQPAADGAKEEQSGQVTVTDTKATHEEPPGAAGEAQEEQPGAAGTEEKQPEVTKEVPEGQTGAADSGEKQEEQPSAEEKQDDTQNS